MTIVTQTRIAPTRRHTVAHPFMKRVDVRADLPQVSGLTRVGTYLRTGGYGLNGEPVTDSLPLDVFRHENRYFFEMPTAGPVPRLYGSAPTPSGAEHTQWDQIVDLRPVLSLVSRSVTDGVHTYVECGPFRLETGRPIPLTSLFERESRLSSVTLGRLTESVEGFVAHTSDPFPSSLFEPLLDVAIAICPDGPRQGTLMGPGLYCSTESILDFIGSDDGSAGRSKLVRTILEKKVTVSSLIGRELVEPFMLSNPVNPIRPGQVVSVRPHLTPPESIGEGDAVICRVVPSKVRNCTWGIEQTVGQYQPDSRAQVEEESAFTL